MGTGVGMRPLAIYATPFFRRCRDAPVPERTKSAAVWNVPAKRL
jgi:hypothetical protein